MTVVVAPEAAALERLAAAEVQRYAALLSGTLPPLRSEVPPGSAAILVGEVAARAARDAGLPVPAEEQGIMLRTLEREGRRLYLVGGGSPAATQWAAYRLLELLGCGFFLGGDALPPTNPDLAVPWIEAEERPVFSVRGTLPWYNFLNGPTTWNLPDHRRFYDQLAKQRANFVGFHSYDWEPWAAYPTERSGLRLMEDGEPAATAAAVHRRDIWGVSPVPVEEYAFGTGRLFERGLFGADVALDWVTHDEGIERAQQMLAEALHYARARGIRTCVGFEVSGDPRNPANEQALRARLAHVLSVYPLDYVWLWQAEHRGIAPLSDVGDDQDSALAKTFAYLERPDRIAEGARMARYVNLGHRLLRELAPQVRLIVSGWGGDQHMRFTDFYQGLHECVPREVIFSALDNIDPTAAPTVSAVYARVAPERECWPILWFESDAAGTRRDQWSPQPNVQPFAPLIQDSQGKGCRGILGIHWRMRAVEETAGYLFRRAWDARLSPAEFFATFARASYGQAAAEEMARIHLRLEELGPRWTGAAGQVECWRFEWFSRDMADRLDPPDAPPRPFRNRVLPDPERTRELAGIRERVAELARGAGNSQAERFAYLLAQMRWVAAYDRAALQLYPGGPVEAMLQRGEAARRAGDLAAARQAGAEALALLERSGFREAVQDLAEHVSNQGELGILATINGKAVVAYKALLRRIEALLGAPAPEPLAPGPWPRQPRVLLPVTPDLLEVGAEAEIRAIVLSPQAPQRVEVAVAPWGKEQPAAVAELRHRRGGVYRGMIPLEGLAPGPIQGWVRAQLGAGDSVESRRWPALLLPAGQNAVPLRPVAVQPPAGTAARGS